MHRVHVVGHGSAEVRIYPLRRKRSHYRSYQVRWYELGEKQTKTLADPQKAKAYAQQVHISLLNSGRASEITPLDIRVLRDAEAIAAKFGVSLPFAIREWADTREALLGASMVPQANHMAQLLKELTTVNAQAAAQEYIKLKEESGLSPRHIQTVRQLLTGFSRSFAAEQLHEISVQALRRFIDGIKGSARTKNNFITCLRTFFLWAQKQCYVRQDRPTAAAGLDKKREAYVAPQIFTPDGMRQLLATAEEAMINANLSGRRARGRIFISKAVILLCAVKKSRDADHLQNFVYDEMRGIDPDTLADELRSAPEYVPVPDYAFDCHTRRGEAMGKTKADFFKAEQAALVPLEQGLFDHLVDA